MNRQTLRLTTLATMVLIGCGQHVGLDIASLSAAREADDHVTVSVGAQVNVTGDPEWAGEIDEVCARAEWADDSGAQPISEQEDDAGAAPPGTGVGGEKPQWDPDLEPRPTGPALFSAEGCTRERFTDGEVKVLALRSSDAIPKRPLLITISLSASDPGVEIRDYMGNQISSP